MIIKAINILDLIQEMGESFVSKQLSLFSCPSNSEIENYLKNDSIDFAKRGISITYLVYGQSSGVDNQLLGYFSLTYKILRVEQPHLSRTTEKRISRFGEFDKETSTYSLATPLIAQFGKNYSPLIPHSISGTTLMHLALDQLLIIQHLIGGRIVFLECEDNPFLLAFYEKNGFIPTSKRYTSSNNDTPFYHQLIRVVK